jgi:type I restriction enzyme S subunit
MSKQAKSKTVPKLRFPEFKNSSEWNIEPLGEVYSFKSTNSLSRENLNYEDGEVKNIHYGDIHTKFSTSFDITKENVPYINPSVPIGRIDLDSFCREGDMIFADASEDLKDVGKSIEIVNLNNEKLLSGLHTLHARQKQSKLITGFGGHLFTSPSIKSQIQRESQGAKVYGISATRLANIQVYYPQDRKEQQKIAGCLSSLDELIASQNQKLDALKFHKKGLMQQLFPAEGETVPKLRLKAFRNGGEWEQKNISEFAKVTTGAKDTQNKVDNGTYPFFVRSQNIERINSFSYDGEAILTSGDGVGVGKNFHYIKGKFDFHQRVYCIYDFSDKVYGKFVYLYFSEHFFKRVMRMSAKNSVDSVRMAMITEMPISLPGKEEQRRIAECLFTLDDLITAQSQKIDSLKAHKKGLIQQMFPVIQE